MPAKKKPEIMNVRMMPGSGTDLLVKSGGRYDFKLQPSGCLEVYDEGNLITIYSPTMWKMINYVPVAPPMATVPEPEAPTADAGEEEASAH